MPFYIDAAHDDCCGYINFKTISSLSLEFVFEISGIEIKRAVKESRANYESRSVTLVRNRHGNDCHRHCVCRGDRH